MSALCTGGRRPGISGHPRGVAGVRAMVEVGAERGVPTSTCLRDTGISALTPSTVVLRDQELRVADNLVHALGPVPGLGLAVGDRFSLRAYGVWGFALMTSPTVRHALELGLRYLPLTYAVTGLRMTVADGEVRLLVDAEEPFLVEREIATVLALLRAILDELPVSLRVELRSSTASWPVPARSGMPHNALVADASVLAMPLPHADPVTHAACERACQSLLFSRPCPDTSQAVRHLVASGVLDAPTIASRLHMSARTLRRHLAAEQTSVRAIVDEVRRSAAFSLLGRHSVGQVAARLGYTDAATFIRAFRRWTGTTPGAYRG